MARTAAAHPVLEALERLLPPDEPVVARGRCWVARERRLRLFLPRERAEIFLTPRRFVVCYHTRGRPRPEDIALTLRYDAVEIVAVHRRWPLYQLRLVDQSGIGFLVEFRRRQRGVAVQLQRAIEGGSSPHPRTSH